MRTALVSPRRTAPFPGASSEMVLGLFSLSTHTPNAVRMCGHGSTSCRNSRKWQASLQRWSDLNAQYRRDLDDAPVPYANEEYLLYQTLLGACPPEPYSPEEYATFVTAIQAYILSLCWKHSQGAYELDQPKSGPRGGSTALYSRGPRYPDAGSLSG